MPEATQSGLSAADAVTQSMAGTRKPFVADETVTMPMSLLSRTVKRTARKISAMQPGQVLAVVTDDP